MKQILCPVCECSAHSVFSERRAWRVVSCDTCSFQFANPMPEGKDLAEEVVTSDKYSDLSAEARQHLTELAEDIVQKVQGTNSPGRLLDVGCGPGVLLQVAKQRGWETVGIELSENSLQNARNAGLSVLDRPFEECRLDESSFDVVVLHHVLEHIPDPNLFLAEASRVLKPGGVLFIAVPNRRSWRTLQQGDINAVVYQTDHVLYFDSVNLKRLVQKHFDGVVAISTHRIGGRAGALIQSSKWLTPIPFIVERLGLGVEIRCTVVCHQDNGT